MDVEKIGRYEVRSELGRGGMSTVYCAFDPQMSREVALKVLPRELLHDPQFRARFEREARTIAMLEHPAIVPIYDFGEEDGQPYFTMRYMTGGSLSERLKKGKLTLQEAARIFDRLAPALDEAHEKNIIHRDLKPGNILFDRLGDPYVSDFGIAKIAESPASYTGSSIIGTPAYMSPEQAQGESLDSRSDIYGMGVILFEMLSGRQPYEADTPMGVAVKHITDPVPRLLDANPDLPPAIEPVIQKALAKRKDDRFSNAAELAVALGAVARGESPDLKTSASATRLAQPGTRKSGRKAPEQAATVLRPARRKRGLSCLIIPLLAVVLLGGGTAALYFTGVLDDVIALVTGWISGTPPAILSTIEALPSATQDLPGQTPETPSTPAYTRPVVGGADLIAFLRSDDLWVMNVDGTEARQLTSDGAAKSDLQFTPDGRSALFISGKCVQIVDIETAVVTPLTCFNSAGVLDAFEISPDGNQVAVSLDHELFVVPFDLAALAQAHTRMDIRNLHGCFTFNQNPTLDVRWSADSNKIAIEMRGVDDQNKGVDLIRVLDISECDSFDPFRLDEFPGNRFTPEGYTVSGIIPSFDWDGNLLFILNGIVRNEGYGSLYLYNIETRRAQTLLPIDDSCCYRDARWSPDGNYLLFAYQDMRMAAASVTLMYYIPAGIAGAGANFSPLLPSDFFTSARESPRPALRPARP